jgi:hypothetical protein
VIGLFRGAGKEPAKAAPLGAPAEPKPVSPPTKAEAAKPRRMGKWRVLVGVGVVALLLLGALVSAWRSNRRAGFPEPRVIRPRPADASPSTTVQSPGRFEWDFRQGVDERNMVIMPVGSPHQVCEATSQGFRCTLPPGFAPVRFCGLKLNFDLRGDFEITARYRILSLPVGEPRSHPGVKLTVRDAEEEVAMVERQHVYRRGEVLTASHFFKQDGKRRRNGRSTPTTATSGRLRLRRSGTTLRFLAAAGDSEEFVELWTTEFSPNDVARVDLAAQTGGAPTGIDMVWTDLDIQADALVGIAVE